MIDRGETEQDERATLVVFDTDCVLCSAWVHFLLRHERDQNMRFISAWSDAGLAIARRYGLDKADLERTYLVVDNGLGLTQSDASLALLAHLRAPWRWLRVLVFLPGRFRDALYDLVAGHRYQWFGRAEHCFVPPPESRHRFIDAP
jgi:predicted DCC family thiol-disulfide oxidoreductase YuxK